MWEVESCCVGHAVVLGRDVARAMPLLARSFSSIKERPQLENEGSSEPAAEPKYECM